MSRKTDGRRPDALAREVRQAALARDAARGRLRRLTQVSIATAVALGGAFAALAAGSTHTKKAVHVPAAAAAPRTARAAVLVQAPAPPLVEAQSAAPEAPAPPAAAPAPTYAPPVVVSGGS